MYYAGGFDIRIGSEQLALMSGVEIVKSVEQLADTATIVLPGAAYNQALDVEEKVKRGDKVTIKLGYNGELATEFEGWLQNIATDDGSIKLECEDDIYLTRQAVPDKVFTDVTVKEIVEYVGKQFGLKVSCTYDFMYNKFTIHKATGFDVLKLVQDEVDANIFIKNGMIHVHPAYQDIAGYVVYDFSVNIESSDLKYMRAVDRKYQVEVEGIQARKLTKTAFSSMADILAEWW